MWRGEYKSEIDQWKTVWLSDYNLPKESAIRSCQVFLKVYRCVRLMKLQNQGVRWFKVMEWEDGAPKVKKAGKPRVGGYRRQPLDKG